MFEFTIKSTKDVKKINIEFGDETSEVLVDTSATTPSAPEPVEAAEPEPVAPPPAAKKARAEKAPPQFDPFERAATGTGYGVRQKPKAVAVDPEPVEDTSDRPDKVDLDFGNSSF